MANTKKWTMNDTQKAFLNALANGGLTLEQVNNGRETEIKTGSINTLISKQYVETTDAEFKATETLVVKYPDGTEITKVKDKVVSRKVYTLTDKAKTELGIE